MDKTWRLGEGLASSPSHPTPLSHQEAEKHLPRKRRSKAGEMGWHMGTPAKSNHEKEKKKNKMTEWYKRKNPKEMSLCHHLNLQRFVSPWAILSLALSSINASSRGEKMVLHSYFWCMDHSENFARIPENCTQLTKCSISWQGADGSSATHLWTHEGPLNLHQILKYAANMCCVFWKEKCGESESL